MKMPQSLRIKPLVAATVCALGLGATQFASAESGPYVGASLGNAKAGIKDPTDDVEYEETDYGYKLFAGYKFLLLSVEAGYMDFGEIEDSGRTAEITGFSAFGRLSMGLGPAELYVKAGGFAWDNDISAATETFEDDGFDPAAGIGAEFTFGGLGVRAEYEYFDLGGDFEGDVSMMSVGATYWF